MGSIFFSFVYFEKLYKKVSKGRKLCLKVNLPLIVRMGAWGGDGMEGGRGDEGEGGDEEKRGDEEGRR